VLVGPEGSHDVVSDALTPGGGVARRPLHLIIMGDCSGSMSEAGADRGALAQQLLRPEVVPGSGLDDDPIL
jgi:hypothetical protein